MNTMSSDALIAIVVILAVVVVGLGLLVAQRQRTLRLRQRFGPEYDQVVARYHSTAKGEAELRRREQRAAKLKIVELSSSDAQHYSRLWEALQSRFVDDPRGAVIEADQLVRDVMHKRGFPMAEFENLAPDIAVRYPNVVSNYRAARSIAVRTGESTDTEDLRKAVVHYRSLFDELLGIAPAATDPSTHRHIPVHS